ncbi:pentapeptide repeat-containing protein [Streptomyces axinellae]|uniref:Pentapeptide repeat-containing protein n=1 Tax=Streptomyces axinellae TaxID=552788 RepID=A0ABN3Q4X0_9ACTN
MTEHTAGADSPRQTEGPQPAVRPPGEAAGASSEASGPPSAPDAGAAEPAGGARTGAAATGPARTEDAPAVRTSAAGANAPRADWSRRAEIAVAVLAGLATLFSALAAVVTLQVQARQGRSEVDVTRQGQITDRFNEAVSNLGDQADEVRLGGIFALRRIMEDSPRDQPAIVDILSAYVRTHTPAAGGGKAERDSGGRPAPDVRATFETLSQRDPHQDQSARVDLRDTYLRYIGSRPGLTRAEGRGGPDGAGPRLANANLSGAVLSGAHLRHARLSGTYLVGTRLDGADLRQADLHKADLRGAELTGADLEGADLRGARLRAGTDPAGEDGKDGSGTDTGAPEQPARVSVGQLLRARLDSTTLLPASLEHDSRLRKRLSRAH